MADVEVLNGSEIKAKEETSAVSFSAFKPQLVVDGSKIADAVEFYKSAFGAEEVGRTTHPKRKIDQELPLVLSAELKLSSAVFSVSGSTDGSAVQSGAGCVFYLETESVEAAISQALTAGAVAVGGIAVGEVAEGEGACAERVGKVQDPYGFVWMICSPAKTSDMLIV